MRNPGGVLISSGPGGVHEVDTFTCAHCQRVTQVRPKERPEDLGGFCTCCAKPVCATCHANGTCTPIEKWLEAQEAKADRRREYGL
jgi:hypothetical protein